MSLPERMLGRLATVTIPILAAGMAVIAPTPAAAAASAPVHARTAAAPRQVHTPASVITPNGSWLTYHHDDGHTGFDSSQPGTVTAKAGWTSPTLDATVFGSPVVYNGIVYVGTMNNTVYALNQSDGTVVWSVHLRAPETGGWACGGFSTQGIVSTPVIDPPGNNIYVVTFGSDDLYRVEGLRLTNGTVTMSTIITTQALSGFDWTIQDQRGALAYRNGYVYVAFGGRDGDCGPYHGWLFAVPTAGGGIAHYATPGTGAGFWNAGGVVIDDATGHVYDSSGNGVGSGCANNTDGTATYVNDAVMEFPAGPNTSYALTYFYPLDWQNNWCGNDQDLGSASMVLINSNLAFQAGKWGQGFLVNPQSLGGMNGQLYPAASGYTGVNVCVGNNADANFGSYAYAAPYVYLECNSHGLVGLQVNTSTPSFSQCDLNACGAPSISMGGTTTFGPPIVAGGAVWAVDINGGGLYGFNSSTGAQIFHSGGFTVNHFSTPSEAGGQIFVSADNQVLSFTMVPGCLSVDIGESVAPPQPAGTPVTFTATANNCPNPSPLYEFWLKAPGASTYTVARTYSTSNAFNWVTTGQQTGTWVVNVWVKDAMSAGAFGNSSGSYDAYNLLPFRLTGCAGVHPSASPASGAMKGTAVVVTANAIGCAAPLYEFWILAPGASSYTLGQAYSATNTYALSTSLSPGAYRINVWVEDANSGGSASNAFGSYDAYNASLLYNITPGCPSVSVSASPPNSSARGTTITFTASAPGCPNPNFQFWILSPGATSYTLVKPYSTTATFTWSSGSNGAGTYRINVWVRDASSSGTFSNAYGSWDAYNAGLAYRLT